MNSLPPALLIGNIAKEALHPNAQGKVMGVTSKGIFILLERNIVFISEAKYRSPFNIIVERINLLTDNIKPGDILIFNEGEIRFESSKSFGLSIANTPIWIPDSPPGQDISLSERKSRANYIRTALYDQDPTKGWNFLASEAESAVDPEKDRIRQLTKNFVKGVVNQDIKSSRELFSKLLGLGSGLTPSGDDWITGFILMKTRLKQASGIPDKFLESLIREIIELSFQKTTTISANRILAASRGMSEELFLEVVDSLINAEINLNSEIFSHLNSFGHSSGVDTVLGITSAAGM